MKVRAGLAASVVVIGLAGCGSSRGVTVVNDVSVTFDTPSDRLPVDPTNARLSAAAREVRELLGHPLAIVIDASLAPEYRDGFDRELISVYEDLAAGLEADKKKDETTLRAARAKLSHIVVRYAPAASRDELGPHWDPSGTLVVTVSSRSRALVPVGDVLWLLRETSEQDRAADFARRDPESVPAEEQAAYIKWLRGSFDARSFTKEEERNARKLARIGLGVRFFRKVEGAENRTALLRFLVDTGLRDLAWDHAGKGPAVNDAAQTIAAWLERDFATLPVETRGEVLDVLLGRGVKNQRLLECAFTLSARTVDAWRSAGHPLPSEKGASIPREFEVVVCPHPKNDRDTRSLAPRCEGGIVRLAMQSASGRARLAELLRSRKDPIFVEHVMVSAGYSTYDGGAQTGFELLRAVEGDPASLRMALRVLAEEHAHGAIIDVWIAEMRRLWLARPDARGTILYVLAHLDPYGNGKVDFGDFAGDFGAKVNGEEAKAYFTEGYRALSLAYVVWPAFDPDFSRAAIIRPFLDAYLEDDRVPRFSMRDPYESLVRIRHRLCEEGADADLRALSTYFAARVRARPGKGLDDMSKTFDPKTCDPRRKPARTAPPSIAR
ncbi:MAG: hypothetical protein ABW133_12590 [Polyangiaceae bacterium]